ncbi:MAG: HAD-IB family phosphatase [Gammaproteobacteria bacterium]
MTAPPGSRDVPGSSWAVICDFDGTISLKDGTDGLLQRYGLPGWEALEARWVAGEITSLECMRGQIALLEVSAPEFARFAADLPVDEHFPAFAAACARRAFPLVVASDGLDQLIHAALGRLNLPEVPVCSGRLETVGSGRYQLGISPAEPHCPTGGVTCKCAIAAKLAGQDAKSPRRILLVGDGRSDFCVAANVADLVFARGKLLAYCTYNGIPFIPCNSFDEATRLLGQLADTSQGAATAPPTDHHPSQRIQEPWLQN